MAKISTDPGKRIVWEQLGPKQAVIRSWYDPRVSKKRIAPWGVAKHIDAAKKVLTDSRTLFGWKDYHVGALRPGTALRHGARWQQLHDGVPVDRAQVVVGVHADGTPSLIVNQFHYGIPAGLADRPEVSPDAAWEAVRRRLEVDAKVIDGPRLLIHRWHVDSPRLPAGHERKRPVHDLLSAWRHETATGKNAPRHGEYLLVWEVRFAVRKPYEAWRILFDVRDGEARLLQLVPESRFAPTDALVFDPNPIVTSGDLALTWNSPHDALEAELVDVALENLDDPDALVGTYVTVEDFESPTHTPTKSDDDDFKHLWADDSFRAVMAYHHLDRIAAYVHGLGIPGGATWHVFVDHAASYDLEYSEFRHDYYSGEDQIALGRGSGASSVPDATDADVIVHEYAHFLAYRIDSSLDMFDSGLQEGFADFVAALWFDEARRETGTVGQLFLWNAAGGASARTYEVDDWVFDAPPYSSSTDGYERGQLWAATLYDLYHDVGGASADAATREAARAVVLRLHLRALGAIPSEPAVLDVAQAIETEDKNEIDHGLHCKVIHDAFLDRHVVGLAKKPVDLFVDDGRKGTYDWREVFWDTQDIWARHEDEDYATAAARDAGTGADHQQPVVDRKSMISVRVKNRGSQESGEFTVRLFRCSLGIGLDWPAAWTEVDSLSSTGVPVGDGPTDGIVVGPLEYTPTNAGHECLLAVVESAEDPAITEELGALAVPDAALVRFDNNIAQRNLVPLESTTDSEIELVNNADAAAEIDVAVEAPAGWRVDTDFGHDARTFEERERRKVKVSIRALYESPSDGPIHVVGRSGGRVIGGVSFVRLR